MKIYFFLFLVMIFIFLTTNFLFASSKLSEVMDSANEKKTETKKVYKNKTTNSSLLFNFFDIMVSDDDVEMKDKDDNENLEKEKIPSNFKKKETLNDSWIGFKIGDGRIYSNKYGNYKYLDFFLGDYYAKKSFSLLVFGLGKIDLADHTIKKYNELKDSIDGSLFLLNIGGESRIYFTPRHTFFGNYLLFGARINYLIWKYKKEIYADVYDEETGTKKIEKIKSDSLFGLNLYTGWGFNIMQSKKVDIGVEIIGGAMLWWFETNKGFKNDVFDPFTYINLNLVFSFK